MASGKQNNWGKYAKKSVKKAHRGIVAIGLIFLLIGFAVGYFGAEYLSENDHFTLRGEKDILVEQGSLFLYQEEGVEIVSLGRDISNEVSIDTDIPIDANGNYQIDTSVAKTYIITYTVDDIKYGNIKRIRTITVTGG